MKIELDENNYLTGNWAEIGGNPSWVEVEDLPDEDQNKLKYYKYENDVYTFDEELYNTRALEAQKLEQERLAKEFEAAKVNLINQSKYNLAQYLETHPITSTCHGGVAEQYSITSEKQSYIASIIMTAQIAQAAGISYQPSWNAAGKACTYDWTLEELTQLAMEMEAVVRPLISKQQVMEVNINECTTIEELQAIDISFETQE